MLGEDPDESVRRDTLFAESPDRRTKMRIVAEQKAKRKQSLQESEVMTSRKRQHKADCLLALQQRYEIERIKFYQRKAKSMGRTTPLTARLD